MDRSAAINRASWDERAPAHAASPGYARQQFIEDSSFLSAVVRFDVPLLGDIRGLRGVHLQCHIGTDTISLARLGASMTGVDFSSASVAEARQLAAEAQAGVEFVEADVYDAVAALSGRAFDLMFTGIGALCWLPSASRWAAVVAELLAPGGRLFIREGHPMLWSLDERHTDALVVDYDYFERPEPMVFDEQGTYVETDVQFQSTVTHVWNHGLGEIVTALLDVGMEVTGLVEHDSVPWEALPGQMEKLADKEWRLRDRPWRLPHSYTLQAVKRATYLDGIISVPIGVSRGPRSHTGSLRLKRRVLPPVRASWYCGSSRSHSPCCHRATRECIGDGARAHDSAEL